MAAWVLLRHELPDGSWHYDWLVESSGMSDDAGLISFRLGPEIAWPPTNGFEAIRMAPHRRMYLDYEGTISGGRGRVSREARGECEVVENSGQAIRVRFRPEALGAGVVLVGRPDVDAGGAGLWRFNLESV